MTDIYGQSAIAPFALLDPEWRLWSKAQMSLLMEEETSFAKSPVTWPEQGIVSNGRAYEVRTFTPPINESDYSSQRTELLRTPQANLTEAKGDIKLTGRTPQDPQVGLADQVKRLLPTPSAGNFNDGEDLENWEARRQRNREKFGNGNGQGTPLSVAVRLLPTPAARDHKGGTMPESEEATRRPRGQGGASDLPSAVKLLPTPRAQMAESRNTKPWLRPLDEPQNLENAIARVLTPDELNPSPNIPQAKALLPTPTTAPMTGNGHARNLGKEIKMLSTPNARDWKGEPGPAHEHGGLHRDIRLMPTPRSSDANGAGHHGEGGGDLRTMIQEIGDHTRQLSEDGSECLNEVPPTLWMQKDD